jgi:plasmid stabilization system protein ParE
MANASVVFHRLAARDYRGALRWYARRSSGAAQRFRTAIDAAVQCIANAPQQGSTYHGRFRWTRVGRYPFGLYCEVNDPALVRILAVAHGRRHPGYWLRRARP